MFVNNEILCVGGINDKNCIQADSIDPNVGDFYIGSGGQQERYLICFIQTSENTFVTIARPDYQNMHDTMKMLIKNYKEK